MANSEGTSDKSTMTHKVYTEAQIKDMPNFVDPYQHQKKYITERRKNDPEFKKREAQGICKAQLNRYHTDPEYRNKRLQAARDKRRLQKEKLKSEYNASSI